MTGIPGISAYQLPRSGELPANTAQWTLEPDRAVLLIHDMQRYFLRPFPEAMRCELVRNAALLRETFSNRGVPIAYTMQAGNMTDDERGLLKDFWGPGMRADDADREIVDGLGPAPVDWLLTKRRYSAFFRSGLLERMRDSGRDQLVLCGVYAHVGVLVSAVDAYTNDIQCFLIADAIGDFSSDSHWMAVRYAAARCAVVLTTEEAVT